jgi:hypothetical protein
MKQSRARTISEAKLAECVADAARSKLPLRNAAFGNEHEYASIPLCVMDAVFSIGAKYASTKLVPLRWAAAQTPPWPINGRSMSVEHSISDFLKAADQFTGDALAANIFKNSQRTSSTSGILKAEAVRQFAIALRKAGIERFSDCEDETKLEAAEALVKEEVKGQRSGISFNYFRILIGHENLEADRMVCRFVACAAGLKHVAPAIATRAVIDATALLKPSFPNLNTRLLDFAIWSYESQKVVSNRKQQEKVCSQPRG